MKDFYVQEDKLMVNVPNEQFIVTDYDDYGNEIEVTLDRNIHVYTEISRKDIAQAMNSRYSLAQ